MLKIQTILASTLYEVASESIQDQVDLVAETLELMKDGVSPTDDLGRGKPFLRSVHNVLQHFVKAQQNIDGKTAELSGVPALRHLFDDMQSRIQKDQNIDPEDKKSEGLVDEMELFHQHEWILDTTQKKQLPTMIKQVLAAMKKEDVADLLGGGSS